MDVTLIGSRSYGIAAPVLIGCSDILNDLDEMISVSNDLYIVKRYKNISFDTSKAIHASRSDEQVKLANEVCELLHEYRTEKHSTF